MEERLHQSNFEHHSVQIYSFQVIKSQKEKFAKMSYKSCRLKSLPKQLWGQLKKQRNFESKTETPLGNREERTWTDVESYKLSCYYIHIVICIMWPKPVLLSAYEREYPHLGGPVAMFVGSGGFQALVYVLVTRWHWLVSCMSRK